MNTQKASLQVSETIGSVSAEYTIPGDPFALLTLAHGAGAGMHHPFMVSLANSLAALGVTTLRYNFPFTENKKGRADVPAVAHKTVEAAIHHAHELFPSLPLFASGKSFGGRMTSQLLALHPGEIVKGIIFYGFPLHPPKKPSIDRAEHLKNVEVPMLFLQGTRDELAAMSLMDSVYSSLPQASLIKLEGIDHSFKAGKGDVIELLANESVTWMKTLL